ncbi:hypothetical protein [Thermus caliditerrae]|uniref:hypothetical protein n=1 Tax=Thermus caliditerrae TaxID=1330700 RepID=UPI000691F60E|nr:hypothetical protein [Thermus caliditerrae]
MGRLLAVGFLLVGLMGLLVACQQGGGGAQLGNPDFRILLSKASVKLTPSAPKQEILVQVVAKNGFNGHVSLSVEGIPEGMNASFNPGTVTPQSLDVVTGMGAATLVIDKGSAEGGNFTIKVVGVSGSLRKEASLSVTVITPVLVLNESFGQGIPLTWEVIDHTGNGAWSTDDLCDRESDYGPLDPIQAPFAIIDSDCLGTVDIDTELRTPSLDLSGYTTVRLHFDHYFYYFSDEIGDVDVSVDGGNTWVNVARFQGEDVGPETHTVDISAIAGGQPNVIIRFHYYDANFDYFWIVDNVRVEAY